MWSKEQIAQRAVKELHEGDYVNLGIGIPTIMANCEIPAGILFQNENGMMGMGPWPYEGEEDPDIISPSKQTVTEVKGASYFDQAESFGMIRGGHLDITFLGGMQVAENADYAGWIVPGGLVKGPGGSMDLANGAKKVVLLMQHTNKGVSKLVNRCTYPITAIECVDMVITNLGVFTLDNGFVCEEMATDVTVNDIVKNTNARVKFNAKYM